MFNAQEAHWFVLHIRPDAEFVAEARLRERSVETFLPLVRRRIRHATRTAHEVKRPLFPGYFFVRFCLVDQHETVRYSHGVLRILGQENRPQPIDVGLIDSIRGRLDAHGCVELTTRGLTPGDPVRITEGPFWGWSGIFERELSDAGRVAILIETLQRQCRVLVRREALLPLAAS